MPTFIKTGYWDKLSKAPKGYLNLDLITGGGGGVTVATKAEIDTLISSNSLVPGGFYEISGVDVPLYGGTTIIIQAATTNELALAGYGIFYNPKYINSQATPNNGYGIWSNYITLTMSSIVGTFSNGQTVTANNGATATYLAQGLLSWISGDWSAATSINNIFGATANVSGGVSPSYIVGEDVIWGGKHWTNTSGNVGTATNKYTLSVADWTAVPFNSTDYNVEIDVIHYDYLHDMIIRRKDRWDNDVDGNYQWFDEVSSPDGYDYGNPIKDFQWGNGNDDWNTDDYYYIGVQSNYVKDSYLECINFIGESVWYNTLTGNSYMWNNTTTVNSVIFSNTLSSYGGAYSNIITNAFAYNKLESGQIYFNVALDISQNTINNGAISSNTGNPISFNQITNNQLNKSFILSNNLIGASFSSINDNILNGNSSIESNTIENGSISSNVLNITSRIKTNVVTSGSMNANTLTNNATLNSNTLSGGSIIQSNTLTDSSYINTNTLTSNCSIVNNTLTTNSRLYDNTLTTLCSIYQNSLDYGRTFENILNTSSSIWANTQGYGGYIRGNNLTNSQIYLNNLENSAYYYNTLTNSSRINFNNSESSAIISNSLNASYIFKNVHTASSNISTNTLVSSFIQNNNINNGCVLNFSTSGTLTSKTIQYIDGNFANAAFDISAATIIYGNYSKQLFTNSAGTARLGYYNASDVFTVVNVNA